MFIAKLIDIYKLKGEFLCIAVNIDKVVTKFYKLVQLQISCVMYQEL